MQRPHAANWLGKLLLSLLITILPNSLLADPWILVDTNRSLLQVRDGNRVLLELTGVAVGRSGISASRIRGDSTTPLGRYHINEIRDSSNFYKYIGLDYPSMSDAKLGREQNLINNRQYQSIYQAHRQGKAPPQDSPLGGYIGLHALGKADAAIHAATNWTKGCIAITDQQMDQLLSYAKPGMAIEIR